MEFSLNKIRGFFYASPSDIIALCQRNLSAYSTLDSEESVFCEES